MADGGAIYQGLRERGFSPVQAAALAGNIQQESSFDPTAWNAGSSAGGLMQWRLDRLSGLQDYATETGRAPSDIDTQLDYIVHEMTSNEAKNASSFLAATDLNSANAALKKYVRYGDKEAGRRLEYAMAFAEPGQGTQQVAANSPQFVNPSFAGGLPAVPAYRAAPSMGDLPMAPPAVAAPAAAVPAAPAMSDEDLLKAFLPANDNGGQSTTTAKSSLAPEDDALLKSFMPTPEQTKDAETKKAAEDGDWRDTISGMLTGSVRSIPFVGEGAVGALENLKAGVQKLPVDVIAADDKKNEALALNQLLSGASAGFEAVPIAGPKIIEGLERAKAFVHGTDYDTIHAEDRQLQSDNPQAAQVGQVAGTVLPYVVGGAIPGVARGLGMTGNLLTRVGMGAASGGAIAGLDTLARGGSVEDAQRNLLTGGLLGGAVPAALGGKLLARTASGAAIGGGLTALNGGSQEDITKNALLGAGAGAAVSGAAKIGNSIVAGTSEKVAELAKLARDKFDIPIGPGQISENPMVKVADSVVNKMPFSGGTVSNAQQSAAFNRAVSKTFGENADALTPDVMAAAKTRIGKSFDDVATRTKSLPYDNTFQQDLANIEGAMQQTLTEADAKPLRAQLDNIVDRFAKSGNAIDGETYQVLTRKGAPLDVAMHSANPNVKASAMQIRNSLDDLLERNAPADVIADLRKARSQWKAMKTVEDLTEKAPTGDISPPLLMGAVRNSYGDMAYGGGGDLADLARIGQQFLKAPPSSGTAERLAVMNLLTKVGGAGGLAATAVMNPGSLPMMAAIGGPAALGYLGAAKGAGALLRSKGLTNKLIENSLGIGPDMNRLTGPMVAARSSEPLMVPKSTAVIDDVFQGQAGPNNGLRVTILGPHGDWGYDIVLPNGQRTVIGKNLLQPAVQ